MWIGGALSLIPMEQARGIVVGVLTASLVWVFLTKMRWAIRMLPPLILPSILLLDAAFVYVDLAMDGWYFVVFGLLHGSLTGLPWAAAMPLGFRLMRDHEPVEASIQK